MVFYGQIVIGPPGCGKTTYCQGMKMFMEAIGRKCDVINLDFANDNVPYDVSIDVRELVSLERVMETLDLGPNGGLVYCMEYLLDHSEWLVEKMKLLESRYVIIDCPGQRCVQDILKTFSPLDCRLCAVHLVDSYYCSQPATFISAILLVAATMLRLGLPHINVDLIKNYDMPFNLDFYTEMTDISKLLRYIDAGVAPLREIDDNQSESSDESAADAPQSRFSKMSEGLCEILEDIGLISFLPLNIEDKDTVFRVVTAVDNANGYRFAADEAEYILSNKTKNKNSVEHMFKMTNELTEPTYARSIDIQERYSSIPEVPSSNVI